MTILTGEKKVLITMNSYDLYSKYFFLYLYLFFSLKGYWK